jgi:signal transduction histidine kinase
VKHAGVDQARVQLHQEGEILTIEVKDKGSGLAPSVIKAPPPGEIGGGLFHMQERLNLFGGHLTLHSSPKIGTRAVIEVPISDSRLFVYSEETS